MDTTKNKITQIASVFDETKIVTADIWAISLVKRHNKHWWNLRNRLFPTQHANIIIQSIQDGVVGIAKLHATKTYKPHPTDTPIESEEKAIKQKGEYLHVQIISNEHYKLKITDDKSAHDAVKLVMGINIDLHHKFDLSKHWDHLTWLVRKESALALIKKVEEQQIEFVNSQPPFWWFGDKSFIFWCIKRAKDIGDNNKPIKAMGIIMACTAGFLGGAAMGLGGICLGLGLYMLTPLYSATVLTTLPFHYMTWISCGVAGISGLYSVAKASINTPQASADKAVGHNCFTWARERLLELGVESISSDESLKISAFDKFIAMTSRHIPANEGYKTLAT